MSNKLKYLDKDGLNKVLKLIKFGHKKIWHGTDEEWEAETNKADFDQAEIIEGGVEFDKHADGVYEFDPSGTHEGITIELVNGVPCTYFRQGQLLIVNLHCKVTGTSTETVWHEYFHPEDFVADDEYLEQDAEIKALIAKAENEAPPQERDITPLQELLDTDIKSAYSELDAEDKRRFLRSFIKEIKVDDNQVVSVDFQY